MARWVDLISTIWRLCCQAQLQLQQSPISNFAELGPAQPQLVSFKTWLLLMDFFLFFSNILKIYQIVQKVTSMRPMETVLLHRVCLINYEIIIIISRINWWRCYIFSTDIQDNRAKLDFNMKKKIEDKDDRKNYLSIWRSWKYSFIIYPISTLHNKISMSRWIVYPIFMNFAISYAKAVASNMYV